MAVSAPRLKPSPPRSSSSLLSTNFSRYFTLSAGFTPVSQVTCSPPASMVQSSETTRILPTLWASARRRTNLLCGPSSFTLSPRKLILPPRSELSNRHGPHKPPWPFQLPSPQHTCRSPLTAGTEYASHCAWSAAFAHASTVCAKLPVTARCPTLAFSVLGTAVVCDCAC